LTEEGEYEVAAVANGDASETQQAMLIDKKVKHVKKVKKVKREVKQAHDGKRGASKTPSASIKKRKKQKEVVK